MKKRFLAVILAMLLIISVFPVSAFAEMNVGDDLGYNSVIAKKTYSVSPGVVEKKYILNDETSSNQNMCYLMEVDLSDPNASVMASYGNMDPTNYTRQIMSKQAAAAEEKLGVNVVGAINVNLSYQSDEPYGILVINGEVYHNSVVSGCYLAVTKDGKAELRDGKTPLKGDEWQAVSTLFGWLVKDGKNQLAEDHATQNREPRTAIGIKADGSLVMAVVDGRQAPDSVGMTLYELAQLMIDAGCVSASNCDGGGSSTFISKREGSNELVVRNTPSDGVERPSLSGLLVISEAKPTGVFDHAVITPNEELYTPGSEIQFSAAAVDGSGSKVDMPADAVWALSSDSAGLGSIDAKTGLFKATAGAEGTVTVQLKSGSSVIGSSVIQLVKPDEVSFKTDEISLGFEKSTDFGLVVKYKGADVNYKVGDIIWEITDDRLGTFDGNIFTSSDGESLNGNVTATSAFDSSVSGTIHLIVGMLPTIVWDFEDYTDPETGEVIPAEEYYTGTNGILTHTNYKRGGKESIEIVSIDDDEPVRMGSHSLKLNYDFTACAATGCTEGACVGTTEAMAIPGAPTGIGVWVYAPEGVGIEWEGDGTQAGFWLRGYVKDGSGVQMPFDFTLEPKAVTGDQQPGIYWEGWKYLEADLTKLNGPFTIQAGMTFRLMYVTNTIMGTRSAGSLYFDNLQFVYGANVDDVDNPVIQNIRVNDTELQEGAVINTNVLSFASQLYDVQNKYTSGVDVDTVRIYIDGVNTNNNENFNFAVYPDGSECFLYDVKLLDGEHSVTVSLRDKFGNETLETRHFTVKGSESSTVPTVSVIPREDAAILGETVNLDICASDATDIQTNKTELKISKLFPEYTVSFAEGYEGSYSYSNVTGVITIEASKKEGSEAKDNVIATVTVSVPSSLKEDSVFSYTVRAGQYTTSDGLYTYSTAESKLPTSASYIIEAAPVILGTDGIIYVKNYSGEAVAGVSVYLEDGTLIGKTDANGKIVTDMFSTTAGKYSVYAKDDKGKLSFVRTVESFAALGESATPYGIKFNATVSGATQKSISWFTNPKLAGDQQIMYAEENGTEWTTVDAKTSLVTFSAGGNEAVSVNSVVLTGLEPGCVYKYKVGSGEDWTEVQSFTTNAAADGANFFVLGDIQAEDLSKVTNLMNTLREKDYDFGIQTGDAVDDAGYYDNWLDIVTLFGNENLGDTDMIQVLGNHEFAGDGAGTISSAIYNLPATGMGSCYSVTYGSVYVAVINYTSTKAQLTQALEWIKNDAAKSNATWKILTMHQPAYYTNIAGGNAEINAILPAYADEIGLDFVFSGHDHAFARTEPLYAGEVNEQHGTVYYICGSSGEKSYAVTDNEDFHFVKATQDYNAIYLSVNVSGDSISITTYDVDESGTAHVFDTYTKEYEYCKNDEHNFAYDRSNDRLLCMDCSYSCSASESLYTGFAHDKETGRLMYFAVGEAVKGYQYSQLKNYNFDMYGLSYEGSYDMCGEVCYFEEGIFTGSDNEAVVLAGYAGEDVSFVLYDDGRLVIDGTGKMASKQVTNVPWQSKRGTIKSVFIGKDVTSISDCSFYLLTNLTDVEFESGSALMSVGGSAFYACSSLESIVLPESVRNIYGNAFFQCPNLKSVYIPDNVSYIGTTAFNKTPNVVLSVDYDSYAKRYAESQGIAYVERKAPMSGTCGKDLTWTLSGGGVLTISGKGSMTPFASASEAPWNAYTEDIRILKIGADVTYLADHAFVGCRKLEDVIFESGSKLTVIGGSSFYKCTSLTDITLPEGLNIAYGNAFAGCTSLSNVYVPNSVFSLYPTTFSSDSNVVLNVGYNSYAKKFAVDNKINYVERLNTKCGENAVWTLTSNGVLNITGSGAMFNFASASDAPWYSVRSNIRTVNIASGITSVSDFAFSDCQNLLKVNFAEDSKLTVIGGSAFLNCQTLTSIVLPESVKVIYGNAFNGCATLSYVYIPDNATQMYKSAFANCPEVKLDVLSNSYGEKFAAENGIPYTKRYLSDGVCGPDLTWNMSEDGTLVISGNGSMTAFKSAEDAPWSDQSDKIKKVVISSGATSISDFAFFGCTNLTAVEFEGDSSLSVIGGSAFKGCTALTSIVLPESLKTVYGNAFVDCTALESIYMPDNVSTLYASAFGNTPAVLNVLSKSYADEFARTYKIPYTVRYSRGGACGENLIWSISEDGTLKISGNGAMTAYGSASDVPWNEQNVNIKNIVISSGVTSISDYAFSGCVNLESVEFEKDSSLTVIGGSAFKGCTALTSIVLPDSLKTVYGNAFAGCTALASIYMPDDVAKLYASAFNNAPVTLNVLKDSYACEFAKANDISYVVRFVSGGACGDNLVWSISEEGTLQISGTGAMTAYASDSAVPWSEQNINIKKLVISSGVTSISDYAFSGCVNLESVEFEKDSSLTVIGGSAFKGCTALTAIVLPDSLKTVYGNAFAGCTALASIYMPDNVAKLYASAFKDCPATLSVLSESYAESFAKASDISYTVRYQGSCGSELSWTFADGVLEIEGSGAMTNYSSASALPWAACVDKIKVVIIGEGVQTISDYAFSGCTMLEEVRFAENSKLTTIGGSAFKNCTSLEEIVIPDNVSVIYGNCWLQCYSLTSVYIPDNMRQMFATTFNGADLVVLDVAADSYAEQFAIDHGIPYTIRGAAPETEAAPETFSVERVESDEAVPEAASPEAVGSEDSQTAETADTAQKVENTADTAVISSDDSAAVDQADTAQTDAEQTDAEQTDAAEEATETITGVCGGNLSWTLSNGVLRVSGSGEMEDFKFDEPASWNQYRGEIKSVIIENGVTTIGAYAFYGLDKLESVTFADGSALKEIRDFAFGNCEMLSKIELPDGLEVLAEGAFAGCKQLKEVLIPASVASIGERLVVEEDTDGQETEEEPLVAVFYGCNQELTLTVIRGSAGEAYAAEQALSFQYPEIV